MYSKLGYFVKNYFFNNIIKNKQIKAILKINFEVKKIIKKEKIAINIYTLKFSLDNKYFCIKFSKKLFNILNKKKLIKIFDLRN